MSAPPGPSDEARERVLDELLALRAREGSREAWEHLVRRWQERLWRHARRLTGADDAAWDVLQETWIAAARGVGALREPAALRRWLYTIATRVAQRRRSAPADAALPTEELDRRPAPDASGGIGAPGSERAEAVADLRRALARLPGDQQALLYMHYLEDFGIADLARVLGVPEGTVKSRLHHARARVRELIERKET